MKNIILILSVLVTIFSCKKENQETPDAKEAEIIKKEVETVLNQIVNGWNTRDVKKAFTLFSDTSEFVFIGIDGSVGNYSDLIEMSKEMFESWKDAKFTLLDSHVRILSHNLVLATMVYGSEIIYPDSTLEKYPKVGSTFILNRLDGKWMVTYFHESSLAPEVAKTEQSSH